MVMISDLPRDIVESEILSRVHIKCRPKLRLTCKPWFDLFKQREVIVLMNFKVYSISYNLKDRINPSVEFTGKLRALNGSKRIKICEIFECDGLILCKTEGTTRVVVWNPCTGETKFIKRRYGYTSKDKFALGYYKNSESKRREYKILRIFRYNKEKVHAVTCCEIYEFRSDSWRHLADVHGWNIASAGASLKGNTYWIAKEAPTRFVLSLLGFDFATERFGRLPLPYQSLNRDEYLVLSVVRDEKLAVLRYNLPSSSYEIKDKMKIWVTSKIVGTEEVAWRKFLSVDFGKFDECPMKIEVESFLVDEENEVALCCGPWGLHVEDTDNSSICVVGNDIYKLLFHKETNISWSALVSYVPSLVHIQKKDDGKRNKRKTTSMQTLEKEVVVPVRKSARKRNQIDNYFPKS